MAKVHREILVTSGDVAAIMYGQYVKSLCGFGVASGNWFKWAQNPWKNVTCLRCLNLRKGAK